MNRSIVAQVAQPAVSPTASRVFVQRRAAFQAAAATNCHEAPKESDALKAVEAAAAKMAARLAKHIRKLRYRRFAVGKASARPKASGLKDALQDAILRYGRLKICATHAGLPRARIALLPLES